MSEYLNYLQKRNPLSRPYRTWLLYPVYASMLPGAGLDVGCGLGEFLQGRTSFVGVDIDPEPLRWGREHYLAKLKAGEAKRVTLLQKDVLAHDSPPVDVVLALNFSYCVFKERSTLLRYIRRCRQALTPGGVLILGSAMLDVSSVVCHRGGRFQPGNAK